MRAWAHVDADDRFAVVLHGVKAVLAQGQAQLVFALGVETPVTLRTGGKGWTLAQFANVNFWMNFERDHENSPTDAGARVMPENELHRALKLKGLADGFAERMRDFPQTSPTTCGITPWPIERTRCNED